MWWSRWISDQDLELIMLLFKQPVLDWYVYHSVAAQLILQGHTKHYHLDETPSTGGAASIAKALICRPTSAQRLFPRARFTHTEQDVRLSSAQFVCCPVPPLLTLPGPAGQLLFGYSSAGWDNHSGHEGWCITTSSHCVSKVRHHLITLSSSWRGYE